jgi:hypothetical protein
VRLSIAQFIVEQMQDRRRWPDALTGWTLPPPAAWAAGDAAPVRVFDTAEAALAFLAATVPVLDDTPAPAGKRTGRHLVPAAVR